MIELSYQLYSSRNSPDLSATLKMISGCGYSQVEGYADLVNDKKAAESLSELLQKENLQMPSCHFNLEDLRESPDSIIEISNIFDINLRTSLIYGHFERVQTLGSTLPSGTPLLQGPFPDERAAVHHLLDEGWMYELRFDDDVVSAGFVIEHPTAKSSGVDAFPEDLSGSPPKVFQNLLRRYPTLDRQFKDAKSVRPIQMIRTLQRKLVKPNG